MEANKHECSFMVLNHPNLNFNKKRSATQGTMLAIGTKSSVNMCLGGVLVIPVCQCVSDAKAIASSILHHSSSTSPQMAGRGCGAVCH